MGTAIDHQSAHGVQCLCGVSMASSGVTLYVSYTLVYSLLLVGTA